MKTTNFRALRKSNNKWVYGYFYEECGNTYIFENRQAKFGLTAKNTPHLVKSKTVSRCLVHNKKVYWEGDVDAEGQILIFCEGCHSWQFGWWCSDEQRIVCHNCDNGADFTLLDEIDNFKPIGNIHEEKFNHLWK